MVVYERRFLKGWRHARLIELLIEQPAATFEGDEFRTLPLPVEILDIPVNQVEALAYRVRILPVLVPDPNFAVQLVGEISRLLPLRAIMRVEVHEILQAREMTALLIFAGDACGKGNGGVGCGRSEFSIQEPDATKETLAEFVVKVPAQAKQTSVPARMAAFY